MLKDIIAYVVFFYFILAVFGTVVVLQWVIEKIKEYKDKKEYVSFQSTIEPMEKMLEEVSKNARKN